jgi:hypothetical protein
VLTEWASEGTGRKATIAEVSQAVYEVLTTKAPVGESNRG